MKLLGLRVQGFKSFADATDVQFHDGITAIVGPNGCGKSNISDAIRWVLGEQRPTAIRGGKMEEAIFQGSVRRRPVNRGSVSMIVSNEDGSLSVPFQEVEIGRTVYRDGGSEYSINRSPCRLRDVVDLCRDTGLGANAYSVIESRMIDAILSDRAEERRGLFEEASGIGKYKDRRRGATRRLERAEADLQRLEDVIAEVRTKVRSLARQKGRAQRYLELRGRRLDVEVFVVRGDLDALGDRLAELERVLGDPRHAEGALAAEVSATEAEYEALRVEQLDAERARAEVAARLDEVRSDLVRWERDLAVSVEREGYAERRLAQIGVERQAASEQLEAIGADREGLATDEARLQAELAEVGDVVESARSESAGVRERLTAVRGRVEEIEKSERDIVRAMAQLEGDAVSADAQSADLAQRLSRLESERGQAGTLLADLASQGDLFADRTTALETDLDRARTESMALEDEVERARHALGDARSAEVAAVDRAGALAARIEALRGLDRDAEGVAPAVRAAIEQSGVPTMGTLADGLQAPEALARAVEAFLGPMAQAVLVQDRSAAAALEQWFRERWDGGGGMIVLPIESAPESEGAGSLLAEMTMSGPGEGWSRALLGGLDLVEDDQLLRGDGRRISRSGGSVDAAGVVRLGVPDGGAGVLERRARLAALESEAEVALPAAGDATRARESAETALAEAERRLRESRVVLLAAEDAFRSARAEVTAQSEERHRVERHREELERQIEGTEAAQARAAERARAAREERDRLQKEEDGLRERRASERQALTEVQEEWEEARTREAAATLRQARVDSELSRTKERLGHLGGMADSARERLRALEHEERQLTVQREEALETREEGERETQRLFEVRDRTLEELRTSDAALEEVTARVAEVESRARRARSAEREATERRHRLELERQEVANRIARARERLEAEWGRTFEQLTDEAQPVEGDPADLADELRDIVEQMARIGPVNMLAVEEHEEESARLNFLEEQRDDLVEARDDLREAIRHINQTATQLFSGTFEQIRESFQATFTRLFQGGEADLWLADPSDPLESPIEIHASPRGKKTQRIDLLSGGERALTALSLLFGIYLVKPSPFCVLDEVDAPLDEANIGRFIHLLQEFKADTQFVVITHNPRTIEAADWIYGVTMEEPGVSSVVGVQLEDALEVSGSAA